MSWTLALAADVECARQCRETHPGGLAEASAGETRAVQRAPSCCSCARATRRHQGLGRPYPTWRLGHHSHPKTSGGARWNYLAAWGYAFEEVQRGRGEGQGIHRRLYRNVPVLDSGARGSTTTFVQRGIGDVPHLLENEAFLALKESGGDQFAIVVPSLSILAEPTVAWVDKVVDRKGTKAVAKAYLEYLYSDEGQDIAGKNFYRPRSAQAAAKYAAQFPQIKLITIDDVFGGWTKAQKAHFADGGVFDQIYLPH